MIQASILEQIITFFNILTSNENLITLSIISIVSLFLLIIATKFKNKKITKILYTTIYVGIFGTLIFLYHTEILKLFDYLLNNIFLFLFFPNLAIYILVLVFINVIIIKSTFSKKEVKLVRYLNIIFFLVFNIIFYLIIDNVIKNNIDVYEQLSIYTNNNLLVLVELSMKLFVIWVLILGIIKLTDNLIKTVSLHKGVNKNLVLNNEVNPREYNKLNTLSEVMEITPSPIEEIAYNYDSYENWEPELIPIKKSSQEPNVTNNILETENLELKNNEISKVVEEKREDQEEEKIIHFEKPLSNVSELVTLKEDSKEAKEIEVLELEDNPMNNLVVPDLEPEVNFHSETLVIENDTYKEKPTSLEAFDLQEVVKQEVPTEKPMITLSSYDSIFNLDTKKINEDVNNNMEVIFDDKANYVENIIQDIKNLKNNENDAKQLEKIYESVKTNQKDLSLNDYNNLINAILEIKNA